MRRWLLIAACTLGLGSVGVAYADVPNVIFYQGRLVDDSGNPLSSPQDVTFTLYSNASGSGSSLWTQPVTGLTLDQGRFSVALGGDSRYPFTPLLTQALATGATLYLQIRVGNTILNPNSLQPIGSSFYAIRSQKADTAAVALTTLPISTVPFADSSRATKTADVAKVANAVLGANVSGAVALSTRAAVADSALSVTNMPGIAFNFVGGFSTIASISPVIAGSVQITTPGPGYVVVDADFTFNNASAALQGSWVIAESNVDPEAHNTEPSYALLAINPPAYLAQHASRVYRKDIAGTYTFVLSARLRVGSGSYDIENMNLVARYYPKAYGQANP
jgi:hypothetical protein